MMKRRATARALSRLSMRAISSPTVSPNGSASRPQSRMIRCLFGKAPAVCRTRGGVLSGGRGRVLEGCDAKPCTQKANAADGAVFLFVRWRRSRGGLRGEQTNKEF